MDWVITSANAAAEKFNVKIGLIVSVNRHESPDLAEQVAWLAADRIKDNVFGIDLAGNEAEFKAEPFYGLFKEARQAGLRVTIHAGEWGPAENIREAIQKLNAERIGHGVRVMEDESVVALAKERKTTFEVCVTSNYQSGVVKTLEEHPLPRMMEAGLNVTVNTDDPSVSRITLSHEYQHVSQDLKLPISTLKDTVINAAQASFLKDDEKKKLIDSLKQEMNL
jgi:adenosine deaminase